MQTELAQYAGFCGGVKRALRIAEECASVGGKWYTLGPLVHNQEVAHYLEEKGLGSVNSPTEIAGPVDGIIVRSHGATPEVLEQLRQKGIHLRDATCPLVKRIHEIVTSLRGEGYDIVIFGDNNHPEVEAILGWCNNEATVIADANQAERLPYVERRGLVSQTTKDENEYIKIAAALLDRSYETRVFKTVCVATRQRQKAARDLCQQVELMLVVGDRNSSNTATLTRECQNTGVRTHLIQKAEDIDKDWLKGVSRAGITAGASTPDWIIKEVMDRMTGYEEKDTQNLAQETPSNEESFARMEAEMADFATPSRGDVIKGTVIQVLDDEVMVDVGGKSEGIIPLREMSVKEVDSARDMVSVGDEIEVLVLKWDDDGTILLSKKKVDTQKILDKLEVEFKEGRLIEGTVSGSVKGGLLVDVGMVGFLPASHVEDGYVKNLDEYIGKTLQFKIIEFNRNKRRGSQIVLSRKELVIEEKNRRKKEFWENIEEGQTRLGRVKRIVDYGAFIDLGGYEGLLHVSELDHRRVEHPSDVLNEGEDLEVYILGLDREKERVSLSRKKLLKSPWEVFMEKYQEGDIVEGTVVRIAPFGAFVEIDPGVDGLVHISQLANRRVEKPEDVVSVNQQVKTKILSIDVQEKRIGLSIREAQQDTEDQEVQEYLQNQDENEEE